MKKLLSLAAVVLTAALIFSGCQNASSSSDDGDKLPGTWSSTAELYTINSKPYGDISSLSNGGTSKFVYSLTKAGYCVASEKPGNGLFSSTWYSASTEGDFTGFKASVKSTASEYYGFAFNIKIVNSVKSYYYIVFSDSSFIIYQVLNGGSSECISDANKNWTQHSAIKASTSGNKITIYADKDSTIHILANGTDVYQIKNPALKQGKFGPVVCLKDTDVTNDVSLTTTYTFTEFQKK